MHLLILRCRFARNKILLTNQSEWAFGHLKKRSRREKDFPWLLQRLFFKLSYSAMADLRICLFITLQLQVLLSVAIYNSHVQWKIKSITFAVSALLRNSEARLLIGFVWNQYRQFYYKRREQFYLCLKRNADEPKDWSRCPDHSFGHANWYCLVKKHQFLPWYLFWYFSLLWRAGQGVVDGIGYRHT